MRSNRPGPFRRRITRLRALSLLAVGATCTLGACGDDDLTLPQDYQGRWYYLGSSGGIAGTGMGDEATGSIVVMANGTIHYHDADDQRLRSEPNVVGYGPSIFSDGDLWILNPEDPMPRVLRLHPDGTLSIADDAYDGFSGHYARAR